MFFKILLRTYAFDESSLSIGMVKRYLSYGKVDELANGVFFNFLKIQNEGWCSWLTYLCLKVLIAPLTPYGTKLPLHLEFRVHSLFSSHTSNTAKLCLV